MNSDCEYLSLALDSNIKSEINVKDEPIETYDAYLSYKNLNYNSMIHQEQVSDAPSTSYIKNENEDSNHYLVDDFNENEESYQYSIGDVVWVNVRGNPLWPAMITYPQDEFSHMRFKLGSLNNSSESRQYHVQFFNDNQRTMWASYTSIILYNGLENLSLYLYKLKLNLKCGKTSKASERNLLKALSKMGSLLTRKATNSKSLRWYRAVEEADEAVDTKMYERTRLFNSEQKEAKKKKSDKPEANTLDSETMSPSLHFKIEPPSEPFVSDCKWETLSITEESESEINSEHSESFKSSEEVNSCASVISSTSEQQECFTTSKASVLWQCSKNNCNDKCNIFDHSPDHSNTVCDLRSTHKKSLKTLRNQVNSKLLKSSECDYEANRKARLKTRALNHSMIIETRRISSIAEDLPLISQHCKVAKNNERKVGENSGVAVQKAFFIPDQNSCKALFHRLERSAFPKVILRKLNSKDIFSPQLHTSEFPNTTPKSEQPISDNDEESKSSTMELRVRGNSDVLLKKSDCEREISEKDNSSEESKEKESDEMESSFEETFSCSLCNYNTKKKSQFKMHHLIHSNRKLFKCAHCDYECNYRNSLKVHLLTHSDTKLFKCSQCNYKSNQKCVLKRHLLIHSDTKLFKCSECNYECNQKCDLNRHLLIHSNIKLFKCSECNYECNQKCGLKRHLFIHSDTKLFKCSECDYECNQKANLKLHLLTHSNTKLFKCSECNYECNQKCDLNRHLLIHSNIKLFKCSECNYECNQKCDLKRHLFIHSDTKLFKCSECDYECNQKANLTLHLLTHSNTKLFKCSKCNYECNRKVSLKRHLLTHSDTKLFKCSECPYKCNRKDHLKLHVLTHSKTK